MLKSSKLFIAGHRGLVGSALMRLFKKNGYQNLITAPRSQLDLTSKQAVQAFFEMNKPEYVIIAAAKVGGIDANRSLCADFIRENLAIQQNIIHQSFESGVSRLIFLGSSCIYPKFSQQPIKEAYLMTGSLEITNRAYATAKIAGIEMCDAYNRQYGTKYVGLMPTNLFGSNDNYHLTQSHVIPALIRKMHAAKVNGSPSVTLWGTGAAYREFLYVDDLASACEFVLTLDEEKYDIISRCGDAYPIVNVGMGVDMSIKALAETIQSVVGFSGQIRWDASMPDGTPKKLLDVSKLQGLGWQHQHALIDALQITYRDYQKNVEAFV